MLTSKQHLIELQQETNERAQKEADKKRKAEDKIAKKQAKMYSSHGNVKKRKKTCRDDDSRRPIPLPNAPKPKDINKGKKTRKELDITLCSGCGKPFFFSKDDWLQCRGCAAWFS